ncbi:hypothetical protein EGP98_02920 [bacterium]|nr:hypothetical protein [bacterium]
MGRIEKNKEKQLEIIKDEEKEHQAKIIKRIVLLIILILVVSFFFILYVTEIATTKMVVREERVQSSKVTKLFHGYKIVNFSDLHDVSKEMVRETVKLINRSKPDLLLFTGDLLDGKDIDATEKEELVRELKKLSANSLKYAVLGENDTEQASAILKEVGFNILENSYDLIYQGDDSILLMGLNSDKENLDSLLAYYNTETKNDNIYSILMMHKPDSIDDVLARHSVDIAFAGHSHLGEVRLPLIGTIITREGAKKYKDGYYDINNTKFFISSGVGINVYDFRFFDRPSIDLIRLNSN